VEGTLYCWCCPDGEAEEPASFSVPFTPPLPPVTNRAFQCPHCGVWLDVAYSDAAANTAEERRFAHRQVWGAVKSLAWASPFMVFGAPALWRVYLGLPVHPLMIVPIAGLCWGLLSSFGIVWWLWHMRSAVRGPSVELSWAGDDLGEYSALHEGAFGPRPVFPLTLSEIERGLLWWCWLPGFLLGCVVGILAVLPGGPQAIPGGQALVVIGKVLTAVVAVACLILVGVVLASVLHLRRLMRPSPASVIESIQREVELSPFWPLLEWAWFALSEVPVLGGLLLLASGVVRADTAAWPWAVPLGGVAGAALSHAWGCRYFVSPNGAARLAGSLAFWGLAPSVGLGMLCVAVV
jgi:hypothetical protein